jgi:hypothetical protein
MDPDPSIFIIDLQDANKKQIKKSFRSRIRIQIWIHTSDLWSRIREAQKHVDPVDPDRQQWCPQHYADLDPVAMRAIIISPSYHRKKTGFN